MKRTIQKWTPAHDKVLMKFVSNFPQNLQLAFEKAGDHLGRTAGAVSGHYYDIMKKKEKALMIVTKNGIMPANVKNSRRENTTKVSPFDVAMIAIKRLPKEQRLQLIQQMMNE